MCSCLLLQRSSFKKCCATSNIAQKGGTQDTSRKNEEKEIEIDNIEVEIVTKEESTKYLGQMVTFQQQETTEIKNRIRAAWATFYKYKQELTSKSYLLRHGGHPNDELRLRNMDTLKRTRKNDSIDAAQNAPAHHAKEKKVQEKDTG